MSSSPELRSDVSSVVRLEAASEFARAVLEDFLAACWDVDDVRAGEARRELSSAVRVVRRLGWRVAREGLRESLGWRVR